jgi:hypothetical protein
MCVYGFFILKMIMTSGGACSISLVFGVSYKEKYNDQTTQVKKEDLRGRCLMHTFIEEIMSTLKIASI